MELVSSSNPCIFALLTILIIVSEVRESQLARILVVEIAALHSQ